MALSSPFNPEVNFSIIKFVLADYIGDRTFFLEMAAGQLETAVTSEADRVSIIGLYTWGLLETVG